MSLTEQLRATAEATKARLVALGIEQETLEFVVAAIEDALTLMRDGSSIESSVLVADERVPGGAGLVEDPAPPSAPSDAGAPVGAGKVGPIPTGAGGASRSNRNPAGHKGSRAGDLAGAGDPRRFADVQAYRQLQGGR